MNDKMVQKIAAFLTEDPNVFCEAGLADAGPQVRNVGTPGYRGNVSSINNRYQQALSTQKADPKKYAKEVQKIILKGAEELASDPEMLSKYLKLVKAVVNTDLVKIAKYYRDKQQQGQQQGQQQQGQQQQGQQQQEQQGLPLN